MQGNAEAKPVDVDGICFFVSKLLEAPVCRHRLLPECKTYSLNVSPFHFPGNLGRDRDQIQRTGVDAAPVLNGEPEFEVKPGRR